MKRIVVTLALIASVLAAAPACGPRGAAMSPAEVQAHGTRTFDAPPAKVFAAARAALELEGYEVALARPEKGLLLTKRKVSRADAVAYGNVATAVEIGRQYELAIEADGSGGTTVTATPRVFVGEADVSADPVWQLDGPAGERALWQRLFTSIETAL